MTAYCQTCGAQLLTASACSRCTGLPVVPAHQPEPVTTEQMREMAKVHEARGNPDTADMLDSAADQLDAIDSRLTTGGYPPQLEIGREALIPERIGVLLNNQITQRKRAEDYKSGYYIVMQERDALSEEISRLNGRVDEACQQVARMHQAAMGEVCGPRRGPVEDIADLKAERDALAKKLAEAEKELQAFKEANVIEAQTAEMAVAAANKAADLSAAAIDAAAKAEARAMAAEQRAHGSEQAERAFRRMAAFAYAGAALYTDDGELQDCRRLPYIDFKRETAQSIHEKQRERNNATPPAEVAKP